MGRMDKQTNCHKCGASIDALVCRYCGTIRESTVDAKKQRLAIEELHNHVSNEIDDEKKNTLLRNGYLPDDSSVLIEAGLKCVPLTDYQGVSALVAQASAQRLEAIIVKLRLAPETKEITKAIQELDGVVRKYREEDRKSTFLGCSMFAVIGIFILVVVGYWVMK